MLYLSVASPLLPSGLSRAAVFRWILIPALLIGVLLVVEHNLRRARHIGTISSEMLKSMGIHKACILYANDHEGRFPTSEINASAAFRKLFPYSLDDERAFYVEGSAWHNEARDKKPDGKIGLPPDFAQCLEKGENHWAYVSGLTTSSDSGLPLIADGFVEGEPGRYTSDPKQKGGVRKGKFAVMVFVSGAAIHKEVSPQSGYRVLRPKLGREVDAFSREGGLPENARVLNPW